MFVNSGIRGNVSLERKSNDTEQRNFRKSDYTADYEKERFCFVYNEGSAQRL